MPALPAVASFQMKGRLARLDVWTVSWSKHRQQSNFNDKNNNDKINRPSTDHQESDSLSSEKDPIHLKICKEQGVRSATRRRVEEAWGRAGPRALRAPMGPVKHSFCSQNWRFLKTLRGGGHAKCTCEALPGTNYRQKRG